MIIDLGYGRSSNVSFPCRQESDTDMGGVDARVSAGAFAGIRTRTGQFLGLSPLPVGLRKRYASNPQGYARAVHDRSGRFVPDHCTHACGGRAYCGMRHDVDHGLCRPCSTETVSTSCGSADKRRNRLRLRKPCPHLADGQIGFAPTPPTGGCSHHPGMMGAGDIRVSVEQTEARIIGHESHGHGFPAGNSQRAWNRIERCTGIEPA